MYTNLPAVPPHPGHAYPSSSGSRSTPGSPQNHHHHHNVPAYQSRTNTAPPNGFRSSGRPRTAPGLPSSLMPGAGRIDRSQPREEFSTPHDNALFFQTRPAPPQRSLAHRHSQNHIGESSGGHATQNIQPIDLPPVPPLPQTYSTSPHGQLVSAPTEISSYAPPRLPPKIPVSRQMTAPTSHPSEPSGVDSTNTRLQPQSELSGAPPAMGGSVQAVVNGITGHAKTSSVGAEEMEKAVALSLAEMRNSEKSLQDQEELELERALRASMASFQHPETSPTVSKGGASILSVDTSSGTSVGSAFSLPPTSISSTPSTLFSLPLGDSTKSSPIKDRYSLLNGDTEEERKRRQMEEDENLARLLAQEVEISDPLPSPLSSRLSEGVESSLPSYEDIVKGYQRSQSFSISRSPGSTMTRTSSSCLATIESIPQPIPLIFPEELKGQIVVQSRALHAPGAVGISGRSISIQPISAIKEDHDDLPVLSRPGPGPLTHNARPNTVIPLQNGRTPFNRTLQLDSSVEQGALPNNALTVTNPISTHKESEAALPSANSSAVETEASRLSTSSRESGEAGPQTKRAPMPIDDGLLFGVSFGFNAPAISPRLTQMRGPIPNVISLPYGKCPPLHIQAPTWKQLLILLTRMCDSRIEPTVEALAGNKADLQLRTVIQFVKAHHSSSEWRTILYLTLDVPVTPSTPNAYKFTNGDVSTLPFSYTLAALPTLLRDSADANLVKYYTVPQTANLPYPTLPIKLPSYARYLHAALEDSRRAMNDSSSGMRRLAKMVDGFYPANSVSMEGAIGPEAAAPDRIRVGGFIKKAFGRGQRNSNSNNERGGNQETYEFITPFRLDEWG